MKLFLDSMPNDDHAARLVQLLTSSLSAHGINVSQRPTTGIGRFIVWLRQLWAGDLAVRIGFGWSDVARNHGTIAIFNDGDDFASAVAESLATQTASALQTQLRGFKRCGYKSDRSESFGDLRYLVKPSVKHNVLLMVCYSSNESNMKSYYINQSKLVADLTDAIKYWVI
jgi:hypothetical protein